MKFIKKRLIQFQNDRKVSGKDSTEMLFMEGFFPEVMELEANIVPALIISF